jgi:hypothetical protein
VFTPPGSSAEILGTFKFADAEQHDRASLPGWSGAVGGQAIKSSARPSIMGGFVKPSALAGMEIDDRLVLGRLLPPANPLDWRLGFYR